MRRAFETDGYVDIDERTDPTFSVGDSALSEFLGLSNSTIAGVTVSQNSALGISAVWRSVNLIAGTVAGLPLKSYKRVVVDGHTARKERTTSFLDDPGAATVTGATPFEWTETVLAHLLLSGNAYLLHVYGGAGQIVGLQPIPPSAVTVEPDDQFGRVYKVTDAKGTVRTLTGMDMTHIPGLSYDGIKGMSVISVARQSLGTAIAGDQAAAKMYSNGLLLGGILSSSEGVTPEQADAIKEGFRSRATGIKNAGDIAFIPADVTFQPYSMNADDAQFLEGREFSVSEVARWYGVPRELLSSTGGVSSWGSGIQELLRAWQKFSLASWTSRVEARLTRLLPKGHFAEFDFAGLLQPDTATEITLLIAQVQAGLISVDEARLIRNMEPLATKAVPVAPETPQDAPKEAVTV